MEKLSVIVSLLFASVAVTRGQECSVDRLPPFGDARDLDNFGRPDTDRFQAIVPAYTFQCSGRVTEWRACADPASTSTEQYYIQFQVWRPTGSTDGCYRLVDYNIPLHDAREEEREISDSTSIIEAEGSLSSPGDSNDPLHRCVVLPVRENHQIEFQSGDVVGYYVDHFRGGDDRDNGGIQWIEYDDVVIHYRDDLPRDDIQSYYAIGGPHPTDCGFPTAGNLYTLTTSTSAAPIVSLSIATTLLTSSPPAGPLPDIITSMVTSPPPTLATTSPSLAVVVTSTASSLKIPSPPSTTTTPPYLSITDDSRSSNVAGNVDSMASSLAPSLPAINPSLPNSSPSPPSITKSNGSFNTAIVAVIVAGGISLLVIIIATVVVILVLLCLRRRKVKSELVDNVAYNCQECEIKTNTNAAYHTVNNDVITATNAAYGATSVSSTSGENDVDIATSTNEAYISTDIATSVDVAYEPVQSSSDNATYETVDVTTLEYDYPRQEN